MVTFFTTFRTASISEKNAIDSWLTLHPETEVIVFTESETALWAYSPRVTVVKNISRHESGPPLLNHIFVQASRQSKHAVLCYCNSDIILRPAFLEPVSALNGITPGYLGVSQRTDADIDLRINFDNPESVALLERLIDKGDIHPPTGSDVFVFPRNQYSLDAMPDLVVGRPGWDLWMIYDARRRFNKVVDLNSPKFVVHQNHPANYNPGKAEHQVNRIYLPSGSENAFTMEYCNFRFVGGQVRKKGFTDNRLKRLKWELNFNKGQPVYVPIMFRYLLRKLGNRLGMK